MTKLFSAGVLVLLLSLAVAAGCVTGDACGDQPCFPVPATPVTTAPQVTDLAALALAREDAPFLVSSESREEKTLDKTHTGSPNFGALRTYQLMLTDGQTDSSRVHLMMQVIMEFPSGNASPAYDYMYESVRSGTMGGNTVTWLPDPGTGDRSFAFTTTQGYSSQNRVTAIVFTKADIMEVIMLSSGTADNGDTAALAKKAAARIPAGSMYHTAVSAPAPATTAPPQPTVSRAPSAAPKGLLVWYDFEDDFTTTRVAKDRSGSGRDATVTGSVARGTGISGTNGISFTGTGYLLAKDNPAAGHKEVTFSFWFKTADPTRNYKFAGAAEWRGGPGTGWTMATHRPEFWADDGPEDLIVPAQPNADNFFVPNQWTLETVVYDGKTMKEYTNGTLINNWQGRNVPMSRGVPMAVGGWPQFSGYNFIGQMDDFRIYDHALTATEITALYQEGRK